ncbi:MAG TPA: hypothetical protein VJQ77_08675 [Novosphingobium sp.]|nr:hypothetical protein [Novosphingobium sp.]
MSTRHPLAINWRNIRLELAGVPEFPQGSASRAYMLHLPLRQDGTIDEEAFRENPGIAGFRRFWPNEPDLSGLVVRTGSGWALLFRRAANGAASVPIELNRLLPGDEVAINRYADDSWRYRVVDLSLSPDPQR